MSGNSCSSALQTAPMVIAFSGRPVSGSATSSGTVVDSAAISARGT